MEQETLMFAECAKSKFGTDLKTEEQQSSQPLPQCVNKQREENTTLPPLCQGQVHSQLHHTWSLAVHACVRACYIMSTKNVFFYYQSEDIFENRGHFGWSLQL